jgi:hypothetical protein
MTSASILTSLANTLVAVTALGANCTAPNTEAAALEVISLASSFGLSMIRINLLCHRILYEKARAMICIVVHK